MTVLNTQTIITGYCLTQKKKHSVVLNLIDTGMGSYLKGRVDCDFVRCGGTCPKCSIANDFPNDFPNR